MILARLSKTMNLVELHVVSTILHRQAEDLRGTAIQTTDKFSLPQFPLV